MFDRSIHIVVLALCAMIVFVAGFTTGHVSREAPALPPVVVVAPAPAAAPPEPAPPRQPPGLAEGVAVKRVRTVPVRPIDMSPPARAP